MLLQVETCQRLPVNRQNPGERPHRFFFTADTSMWDFQLPELLDSTLMLFKPPSLGDFVTAAPGNNYIWTIASLLIEQHVSVPVAFHPRKCVALSVSWSPSLLAMVMESHSVLILFSPMTIDCEHPSYVIYHLLIFFDGVSVHVFSPACWCNYLHITKL